jgi:hypothetical protein
MTSRQSIGFCLNIAGLSVPAVAPSVVIPFFADRSFALFGEVLFNGGSSVVVREGGDPLLSGITEKALGEAQ